MSGRVDLDDDVKDMLAEAAEEEEERKERERKQAARDATKYGNQLPDLEDTDE